MKSITSYVQIRLKIQQVEILRKILILRGEY